jgi:hypothetical protein
LKEVKNYFKKLIYFFRELNSRPSRLLSGCSTPELHQLERSQKNYVKKLMWAE